MTDTHAATELEQYIVNDAGLHRQQHGHARKAKSMADYEAEGYKAQTWYVADAPYSQPKIRDAWQRGAWKWQQEQRVLRPSKAASPATRSRDRNDHARKKSPAQLDREIAQAVPSWRRVGR